VVLVSVQNGVLSNWKFLLESENFEVQVRQWKLDRVKLNRTVNKLKRIHDKIVEQQKQLRRQNSELMTAVRRVKDDITAWKDIF
jgi:DNA primase catalytic subunit